MLLHLDTFTRARNDRLSFAERDNRNVTVASVQSFVFITSEIELTESLSILISYFKY